MTTVTPQSWASNLLQSLGAPDTPASETVIEEWETAEGGNWLNTAKYNPLNVSQDAPGATSINSAGVKAYTSWQQGLDATVQLLNNGLFQPILDAVATGDPQAERTAIANSSWEGTNRIAYPKGLPTSASAAAYAKAHAGGGGNGWSLNPIHDIGKAAGDVGSAVTGVLDKGTSAVGNAAGDALGSAFGAVWKDAKPFILTMAFAGLGLSLIALGGYQATKQKVGKAMQQLQVGAPSGGSGGGKAAPAGEAGAAAGGIPPEAAAAAL